MPNITVSQTIHSFLQTQSVSGARLVLSSADINDTRFGKVGESVDGVFTSKLSYSTANGWQGDNTGIKTFLSAADISDTRFGKVGESVNGTFTSKLSYSTGNGWQGDSTGIKTFLSAADTTDTRFGKVGETVNGVFTSKLSYSTGSGWQGDSTGIKTFLGDFITRFDVADAAARYNLINSNPLPKVGDLVREGVSTYYYYIVVDANNLGSDAGYNLITFPDSSPSTPTSFRTNIVTSNSISFNWNYTVNDIAPSYFAIDKQIFGGTWTQAVTAPYGYLTADVTNLAAESDYSFRISAVTSSGVKSTYASLTAHTPPFDISSLSGVMSWLRADQGLTFVDNKISQWNDLTTNQKHAIQNTASSRPSLTALNIWGYPLSGIDFSGKTTSLVGASLLSFNDGWLRNGPELYASCTTVKFVSGSYAGLQVSRSHIPIISNNLTGQPLNSTCTGADANTAITNTPISNVDGWRESTYGNGRDYCTHIRTSLRNGASAENVIYFFYNKPNKKSSFIRRTLSISTGANANNIWWQNWTVPGNNENVTVHDKIIVHEAVAGTAVISYNDILLVQDILYNRWMKSNLKNFVLFLGDSLTYGYELTEPESYPYKCTSSSLFKAEYFNAGVSGRTCAQVLSEIAVYNAFVRPSKVNIAVVYLGVNGLTSNGAVSTYNSLVGIIAALRAQGYNYIYVLTCLPYSAQTSSRDEYNSLVRINTGGADGVIDIAALPEYSSSTAYINTTYYRNDQLHLTAAGYQLIADAVGAVIYGLT